MSILFVTGRLAEPSLRAMLDDVAPRLGFTPEVAVLPISVAALMTPQWVARKLVVPAGVTEVILPGFCRGDLKPLESLAGVPVRTGPEDLRDLPQFLGEKGGAKRDLTDHNLEILAEINHAPHLTRDQLLQEATRLVGQGADVIDLGCVPGERWTGVGHTVRELVAQGFRVSIDSFDPDEVGDAASAGAELVLSVNASNRDHAADWGVEVVAIPDVPHTLDGLDETVEFLEHRQIPFRIDPVLDPIGFGFAASLGRYLEVTRRYPGASVMMGVGNLTELTDVDSAGVNALLIGFCTELGVTSVLTTEVINWARTSVREIEVARRLMHHAVSRKVLPKRLEEGLVMLRDSRLQRFGPQGLAELATRIKDPNWRLFAEDGALYAINGSEFLKDTDPFELFDRMGVTDPSHAFYLGYELMKAKTALTLSKNYRQDQALQWGILTEPEVSHRERRQKMRDGGKSS